MPCETLRRKLAELGEQERILRFDLGPYPAVRVRIGRVTSQPGYVSMTAG